MLRRWMDNAAKSLGYVRSEMKYVPGGKFYLFDYSKDGAFDYARYRDIQTAGNKRKLEKTWAERETIEVIANYLRSRIPAMTRGLCHGSRNGSEVQWFREILGIDVIGTDISETAGQFPNMVQWDFHDANPDWIGQFDFVYTNSHDHAYDPAKAISAWVDQLRPGGILVLEHSLGHSVRGASDLDPFAIDPQTVPYFILQAGQGEFTVTRLIDVSYSHKPEGLEQGWVFCIERAPPVR